jgi:hypothetical protein
MHGTMAKVDQLFRMTNGPIRAAAFVTVVGSRHRIAASQRLGEPRRVNRSGPAAVTFLPVLAIPSDGQGQP